MSISPPDSPRSDGLWSRIASRSLRFIAGAAVLAILLPGLSMTVPDGLKWLMPWTDDAEAPTMLASAQTRASDESSIAADLGASTTARASVTTRSNVLEPPPAASPEEDDLTRTTKDGQATTATSAPPSTTSSQSDSTTTQPPPAGTGDSITGEVCPCMVTGTAMLAGDITLRGDLMVDGGTLIARPGVNLNGNGFQIMFMNGGKADFQGTEVFTWSGDGSNANLSRDINFRNLRRIIFHQGAGQSILRFFTVSDSGTGSLGDYSIHFHLNGNSTRGTIVEGVVVVGSKNHAFVPHGSHGVTFKDTIAKDGRCEAYWWDPPEFQSTSQVNNSNDIHYDHALADGVTNCAGDNRGFQLAAFELGAGEGNIIRNSVARNVNPTHAKDCAGFKWPELSDKQPSSWTFGDNASYGSRCNGIFVWQNDNEDHIVNGFTGDDGIDHGAYLNRYDYRNVNVPFVEVHALGWSMSGGQIDRVTVFKHSLAGKPVEITNVRIGEFIVNNAIDGGSLPGTYSLNNTGLTCADIVYQSVVPGTKVIINGVEC